MSFEPACIFDRPSVHLPSVRAPRRFFCSLLTAIATMVSSIKRSRDPLSPKPILDRRLLVEALAERDIELAPHRIDEFYQLLHRQHYPPLNEFIETYNRREKIRLGLESGVSNDDNPATAAADLGQEAHAQVLARPFPNPVSKKMTKANLHRLPKALLNFLSDPECDFVTLTTKVADSRLSKDGTTTKLAIELQDGHVVESVIMRYSSPEGSRASLCVSSQVGCAMGCTFCATGTMGIRGNLTSGEILEQIVHANRILASEAMERSPAEVVETTVEDEKKEDEEMDGSKENEVAPHAQASKKKRKKKKRKSNINGFNHDLVRNVVYMGMGEPLNNYDNVIAACRGLTDCRRWNLRHGRVTISTVGVTPKIRKLTKDLPEVALALSLHAPNQAARSAVVPAAKAYPIEGLIDALDEHMMVFSKRNQTNNSNDKAGDAGKDSGTTSSGCDCNGVGGYSEAERKNASKRKRAMIEYVMLEGDTSSFECAHQLGKLCENRQLIVNLIPYNQTDVKDKLRCPPREHIDKFQDIVRSYGSYCYIRRTMGADIAGACGQLVVEKEKGQQADIEDIGKGKKNSSGEKAASNAKRSLKSAASNCSNVAVPDKSMSHDLSSGTPVSSDPTDNLVRKLSIATGIAAACFAISTSVLLLTKRRS